MSDSLAEPLFYWFINLLRPSTFSYKEEKSIITAIQSVTIQIYFIDENALRKKSVFTSLQSTTLPRIILRSFYSQFAIQQPVSTFGIEKVFGLMKTLPAIQKMLASAADFHTGQCKRTGGCYNELVVAFFSTGGGVKGKKIYTC